MADAMKPKERVYPNVKAKPRRRWFSWLRRKKEPSLFLKLLAVHIHGAGNMGALK